MAKEKQVYQVPRGTQDILPSDISKWHKLEELIRNFTYLYNYSEIRTPIFEHTNVFKRGNDSSDMVNKEMYTFTDRGDRSLTLRPEGTAPMMRMFIENKLYVNPGVAKYYYFGPIFRYERPQKGRYHQFTQFGVETYGLENPLLDADVINLACKIMNALGIKNVKVCLNTLGSKEARGAYVPALKEYFTPYLNELCADCRVRYEKNPLRMLDCKIDANTDIMKNVPKISDYLTENDKQYFEDLKAALEVLGIKYEVSDKAGNTATHEQEIKVVWDYAVQFIGHQGSYYGVANTEEAFLYAAEKSVPHPISHLFSSDRICIRAISSPIL